MTVPPQPAGRPAAHTFLLLQSHVGGDRVAREPDSLHEWGPGAGGLKWVASHGALTPGPPWQD